MAETNYKKLYLHLLAEHFNVLNTVGQYANGIVCCKDCKHYIAPGTIDFDDGTTNLAACSIVRAYMVKITPDSFYAWGEWKTEDD